MGAPNRVRLDLALEKSYNFTTVYLRPSFSEDRNHIGKCGIAWPQSHVEPGTLCASLTSCPIESITKPSEPQLPCP